MSCSVAAKGRKGMLAKVLRRGKGIETVCFGAGGLARPKKKKERKKRNPRVTQIKVEESGERPKKAKMEAKGRRIKEPEKHTANKENGGRSIINKEEEYSEKRTEGKQKILQKGFLEQTVKIRKSRASQIKKELVACTA